MRPLDTACATPLSSCRPGAGCLARTGMVVAQASVLRPRASIAMLAAACAVVERPLPLLSCARDKLMLPGDVLEMPVVDDESRSLIEHSLRQWDGELGQLLVVNHSEHNRGTAVLQWIPLLQIMEVRMCCQECERITWFAAKCVGRVKLRHADGLCFSRPGHGFNVADVTRHSDTPMTRGEMDEAEAVIEEIRTLRQHVLDLRGQLQTLRSERVRLPPPKAGPAWDAVTTHRAQQIEARRRERSLAPAQLEQGSLRQRTGRLREVLVQRGMDEPPAASLQALHELWNVDSEEAAEMHLASFAACGWFGPLSRTQAGQCQSTLARLRLVRKGLVKMQHFEFAKLSVARLDM